MKVTIEYVSTGDQEVLIRCKHMDPTIQSILACIKQADEKIFAVKERETFILHPVDIYYAEAVDHKVFLYTKSDVLECQDSLFNLEKSFRYSEIVRIGKSQLVNLMHIEKLKSILHSRIEIMLTSGDKLIVSRHYSQAFKNRLGINP
ncbi:LytTR family DNA-binding domain-containing protein [Cytobacillus gottheilii]|uniref:LytTR family DNA-binding domain-containing protein n=1 Tax=Cytobacillus gottheilii TaxID=859144 RepID=UPI0009BBDCE4|nr:LytTR family DNA-binding domain-containing protein [Cytobacillus gottheilii]